MSQYQAKAEKPDVRNLIYKPGEIMNLTVNEAKAIEKNKGRNIAVPMPGLREQLKVLAPTRLTSVIANSSNWKTGFMQYVAREVAATLNPSGDEVVVFVTWEVSIEELGIFDLANVVRMDVSDILLGNVKDWREVNKGAMKRATVPIYAIGHSVSRRKARPSLSMSNIAEALRIMEEEWGFRTKLVCLDYLQRIQPERDEEVRLQHARNANAAKDLALATDSHVILGVQAKEDVLHRDVKIPRYNDGGETSTIMHVSDSIVTLWKPSLMEGEGASFSIGKQNYIAHKNLLFVHLAKNKFGEVGGMWPLDVDFAQNKVNGLMDFTTTTVR